MKLGQKLVYAAFVALLVSSVVVSHPIRVHAADAATDATAAEAADSGSLVLKLLVRLVDETRILTN